MVPTKKMAMNSTGLKFIQINFSKIEKKTIIKWEKNHRINTVN